MAIDFDLNGVVTTEFGVGREGDGASTVFGVVPWMSASGQHCCRWHV